MSAFGVALLVVVVAALGALVGWAVLRGARQRVGGRALYQELARLLGLQWLPPKNPQDHLLPGRAKGRYRDRTVSVDTNWHRGGSRRDAPSDAVVRVRFARSLGMGLNGGTGRFGARRGDKVPLDQPLSRRMRVVADDPLGARTLVSDPSVAQHLLDLDRSCRGVRIDDGVLECTLGFPSSADAFCKLIDRVVDAVESVDACRAAAEARSLERSDGP